MSEKISMVRRLRLEANALGEFQAYASRDYGKMLLDAADEIERLRVEALGIQRRMQDQDAIMAELWERIHALTAERDEARRETELLANSSVYRGNSVAYIYDKMTAYRKSIDSLAAENAALKAQRDEARREICNGVARRNWPSSYHFDRMRRKYAAERGWDCFDAPHANTTDVPVQNGGE